MNNSEQRGATVVGLAVFGLLVVGIGSAIASVIAMVGFSDFVGGGIFALASAWAFGQLAGGLLRS